MSAYAPPDRVVRGFGVGIELDDGVARGVMLSPDAPGRVARVASTPVNGSSPSEIVDALTRLAVELEVLHKHLPTRIAWHTHSSTIQSVDLTGRDRSSWARVRHQAIGDADGSGSIIVTAGARTVLNVVTWDEVTAERICASASAAGLGTVSIEPAPFSATRVCPPGTALIRRGTAGGHWSATITDGLVGMYATIDGAGGVEPPMWEVVMSPDRLHSVAGGEPALVSPPVSHHLQVGRTLSYVENQIAQFPRCPRNLSVDLIGDLYPDHRPHEPDSVEHVAVALGAALGAAGLHTRWRVVERNFEVGREVPAWTLPWGLEALTDEPAEYWTPEPEPEQRRGVLKRRISN